jgi:fumarylacetoacetate (FAA) hydrolase family protein
VRSHYVRCLVSGALFQEATSGPALGDVVSVSAPPLGCLVNRVQHSDQVTPWTFGIAALKSNLARRGLLR